MVLRTTYPYPFWLKAGLPQRMDTGHRRVAQRYKKYLLATTDKTLLGTYSKPYCLRRGWPFLGHQVWLSVLRVVYLLGYPCGAQIPHLRRPLTQRGGRPEYSSTALRGSASTPEKSSSAPHLGAVLGTLITFLRNVANGSDCRRGWSKGGNGI